MVLKLTLRRMRNSKKTTIIMFLALFLSLFFISSITLYRDNQVRYIEEVNYQRYGKWQIMLDDDKEAKKYASIGTMSIVENTNGTIIGSFDEKMFELANIKLMEGRYPQNDNEIMIDTSTLDAMKLPYKCHQSIELEINSQKKQMTITGIMFPYANNWIQSSEMMYPTIVTTNSQFDNLYYFVSDQNIGKQVINDYQMNDIFVMANMYSYPNLIETPMDEDAEVIDLMSVFDVVVSVAGFSVVVTVFFQQLLKRKKSIYHLCMIGVSNGFVMKESLCEGILLCVTSFPAALISSLMIVYFIFMSFCDIPMATFYQVNIMSIFKKCLLLLVAVIVIFVVLTKVILLTWNRKIFEKIKHRKRRRSLSFMSCLILLFSIAIAFVSIDTVRYWEFYQSSLKTERDFDDYTYFDDIDNYSGMTEDEDGKVKYEEARIDDFEYTPDGLMLEEINDIQKTYGIRSVKYGYIIPCLLSLDNQFSDELTTVVRFQAFPDSREELAKRNLVFSDEEYEQFVKGESAVLVFEDDFKYEYISKVDHFIYNMYDDKNKELNQTMYIQVDGKPVPILVSSQKCIKSDHATAMEFIVPKDFIVSDAFIEKYFGLKDGPYQYTKVRVDKNANYNATDKKMSQFGLENFRIQKAEYSNRTKIELIVSLVQCLLVYLLTYAVFINVWNGYLETKKREIGIMQTIGVRSRYIFQKYWRKMVLIICICMVIGIVVEFRFHMNNLKPFINEAGEIHFIGRLPTDGIWIGGGSITLGRDCAQTIANRIYGLPTLIYIIHCILMCMVSYMSLNQLLKKDPIENTKER